METTIIAAFLLPILLGCLLPIATALVLWMWESSYYRGVQTVCEILGLVSDDRHPSQRTYPPCPRGGVVLDYLDECGIETWVVSRWYGTYTIERAGGSVTTTYTPIRPRTLGASTPTPRPACQPSPAGQPRIDPAATLVGYQPTESESRALALAYQASKRQTFKPNTTLRLNPVSQ